MMRGSHEQWFSQSHRSRRNGPRSEVRGPRFYDNINNEERQGPRSPPRSEAEVPAEVRVRGSQYTHQASHSSPSWKQLGGRDGCFLDPQLLHVSSLSPLLSLMLRGASSRRSLPFRILAPSPAARPFGAAAQRALPAGCTGSVLVPLDCIFVGGIKVQIELWIL